MPFNQALDSNGRAIMAIGYDPVTHQPVMQLAGAGVQDSSSSIVYAAAADAPVDGFKATYAAAVQGFAPTISGDVFTITGAAGKTIRVTRLEISATQTTAGQSDIVVLKRSTANTGGTSSAPNIVPYDKNDPAASATVLTYTVASTPGTLVGNIRAGKVFVPAPASVAPTSFLALDFGNRPARAIVLRGTGDVLAVNLPSPITGVSLNIGIEWSEDSYS